MFGRGVINISYLTIIETATNLTINKKEKSEYYLLNNNSMLKCNTE